MEALKGIKEYPHINHSYIGEESELKTICERNFNNGIQGKMVYMMQWMQNINFLAGNQWINYNPLKKEFEISPNLDGEARITINKILPSYRLAVGSILRDRMKPKVIQVNMDEQSIDAAKVETKLLEHVHRVTNGINTNKEVYEWSAITGKGIKKKWWDPEKETIVDEVIQTFEWVTPSNVRKLDKMPWVCHARYETEEWVYENYGVDLSEDAKDKDKRKINTTGTNDYGQYGSFLAVVKHVMQDGALTGYSGSMNRNNVLIKEFWFRPTKKFKKGLLVIFVNDILLYADKNPISNDDEEFYFPFNEMDWFDLPFRYWPMSLIEPVIGMQTFYNKFQSNALDAYNTNGFGTWWAQDGTMTADEVISDGKTMNFYNGNTPPNLQNHNAFDPKMFEIISQMANGIGEIVGIHQMGRGSLPPGVHAAAALAIINEQDQVTKMGLTVNQERFIRTDAKQTLYLVRKYWTKKQKIRVMGEENRWEIIEFDASVLTGEEEIDIESKQELAQDKMTRFDQVMKLMTTARLDNPQEPILDVNTGLRILDLENEMGTVTSRELDTNMAKDENQHLAKGKKVLAFQFEDHKVHIEAHMQYMKRIEFKELDEDIQHNFIEHWQQHMQMLNGSQNSAGAQASQDQPPQPMMPQMGAQPPQMMGQPQIGQPMPPMQGNVIPHPGMQQPLMQPPMPPNTGLASGLQGGMQNVLNHAAGIPGGVR